MKKSVLMLIILSVIFMMTGCKVIGTVQNDLEVSGYTVTKNEIQASNEYIGYTIYDQSVIVGYIYEFPTFLKARNYFWDQDYETTHPDMTWIIHNQLIVGAYDDDVIHTIVD